ncbi:DUF1642 domain-containing protein [Ligilactobacillus animalis]|uniref:DUF1642 domain-containing protein n=1 Tax=Ligilactobacillus animalis TaxID=1605 RepID=UPI00266CA722|nr:DUF1642 domain-containing protein [Ligilactobacillus animalis]
MTEEKDFWINKDEVGILNGVEGTEYKVTQETMNQKGWYKLAGDEQIVKKVELTGEEAEWFEKNKNLPFFKNDSTEYFAKKALDYSVTWEGKEHWCNLFSQAYFNGYTIKKEKKYYIELNFNYYNGSYLNVNQFGVWVWEEKCGIFDGTKRQFTQDEIDEMQKDPRAKGLDLNELKTEVPEDELEG